MLKEIIERAYPHKFDGEILYHYTNQDVVDIFAKSSSRLYCTKATELNDETEFNIGIERGLAYIEARSDPGVYKSVKQTLELARDKGLWMPWILSFSSKGDDLNQWKGYVSQRDGGYSVGFDRKTLEFIIAQKTHEWQEVDCASGVPPPFVMYMFPCFYDKCDDIDKLLELMFGRIIDEYLLIQKSYPAPESLKRVATIISMLYLFAGIYKHEAFKDENETRIVLQNQNPVIDQDVELVGFKHRIPLPGVPDLFQIKNCVVSIMRSPHGNRVAHDEHMVKLSTEFGAKVKMCQSVLPYRG